MIYKSTINGNWGLDRIDQFYLPLNNSYSSSKTGSNVDICIIDTGIAKNHVEFNLIKVDTLYDFRSSLPQSDTNYVSSNSIFYGYDDYGHGTFIGSIITGFSFGVCTKSNLYSVKIFDKNLKYNADYFLSGLDSVLNFHTLKFPFKPTILYIPFSGIEYNLQVYNKINQIINAGIIVVVAAGNKGLNVNEEFPENINQVITVAGSDFNDNFMNPAQLKDPSFNFKSLSGKGNSNYGGKIDIIAPGFRIKGAWLPLQTKSSNNFFINNSKIHDSIEMSGNAVAGAFVVGVIAMYLQDNQLATVADVKNFLINNSSKNVLKIKKEYNETPNRLLRMPFKVSKIKWSVTNNQLLGSYNEGSFVNIKIESFINDISGKKVKPVYSIFSGSLPPGINLHSDGTIEGKSQLIDNTMPGYVFKNSLPISEQQFFNEKQIGYLDYQFSVLADYGFDSDIINLKIRIIDLNDPPYWVFDDYFDINGAVSAMTFYYKNYVNVDISNIVFDINNDNIIFTLLNNTLPPNLVINSSGKIYGTVKAIYPDEINLGVSAGTISKDYYFTIRATDGYEKIDKWCKITVYRDGTNNTPPQILNGDYETSSLGSYQKGILIQIPLEINDVDDDPITAYEVSAVVSGIDLSSNAYLGIPYGLSIKDNVIEGIVDANCNIGNYYFGVACFDGWDEVRKTFMISIEDVDVSSLNALATLQWITASGKLGEIYETYPSYFYVEAKLNSGGIIKYSLVTSADSLPPGLVLDTDTGLIKGNVGYVSANTNFSFLIKAYSLSSPSVFLTRKFSIEVYKKWGQPISEFYYYLNAFDKYLIQDLIEYSVHEKGIISLSDLYRSSDENYNKSINPKIFIVGGVNLQTDSDLFNLFNVEATSNVSLQKSYFRPVDLRIGDFKIANVRDFSGNLISELIYLEVYDENYKNLGVTSSSKIVFPNTIVNHPMDNFYATGINTWRNKIKLDGGLVNNEEKLSLWMISSQVSAASQDAIGYRAAIELFYVRPGSGNNILFGLRKYFGKVFFGRKITVDRLVYEGLVDVNNPKKRIVKFPPGDKY